MSSSGYYPVVRSLAIACVVVSFSACGDESPFEMAPVAGKIMYSDGSRIEADEIFVTFVPEEIELRGKAAAGAGRAIADATDGSFGNATTWKAGDGVVVGRHRVVVQAMNVMPNYGPQPTKAVAPVYGSAGTTPLTIEVPPGGKTDIELKVDKPSKR